MAVKASLQISINISKKYLCSDSYYALKLFILIKLLLKWQTVRLVKNYKAIKLPHLDF